MPWVCQYCLQYGEGSRTAMTIPWSEHIAERATRSAEIEGKWAKPARFQYEKKGPYVVSLLMCSQCALSVNTMRDPSAQGVTEEADIQAALDASLEDEEFQATLKASMIDVGRADASLKSIGPGDSSASDDEDAEFKAALKASMIDTGRADASLKSIGPGGSTANGANVDDEDAEFKAAVEASLKSIDPGDSSARGSADARGGGLAVASQDEEDLDVSEVSDPWDNFQ